MRKIENYGLIGPTTGGRIKWFGTPEALAAAWKDYPAAKIRLSINGEISHGTAEETDPIYDALEKQAQ